jgi:hypothetical protein
MKMTRGMPVGTPLFCFFQRQIPSRQETAGGAPPAFWNGRLPPETGRKSPNRELVNPIESVLPIGTAKSPVIFSKRLNCITFMEILFSF